LALAKNSSFSSSRKVPITTGALVPSLGTNADVKVIHHPPVYALLQVVVTAGENGKRTVGCVVDNDSATAIALAERLGKGGTPIVGLDPESIFGIVGRAPERLLPLTEAESLARAENAPEETNPDEL
jgi:hypothetical protein